MIRELCRNMAKESIHAEKISPEIKAELEEPLDNMKKQLDKESYEQSKDGILLAVLAAKKRLCGRFPICVPAVFGMYQRVKHKGTSKIAIMIWEDCRYNRKNMDSSSDFFTPTPYPRPNHSCRFCKNHSPGKQEQAIIPKIGLKFQTPSLKQATGHIRRL